MVRNALLAASTGCALVLAFFQLAGNGDGQAPMRGPLEVAGAFVFHIDRGNFGKACGLYAQDARANLDTCSEGFVWNAATGMTLGGVDVYENARIVPGSRVDVDENTVSFVILTDEIPTATLVVERQPSGRWRITEIK